MVLTLRRKNLDEAYQAMQRAVQLDPGTLEIRVDQAQVLARMSKGKEAIEILELALKMSHTPEQTAAVESVLQSVRRLESQRAEILSQNPAGLQGSPSGKVTAH